MRGRNGVAPALWWSASLDGNQLWNVKRIAGNRIAQKARRRGQYRNACSCAWRRAACHNRRSFSLRASTFNKVWYASSERGRTDRKTNRKLDQFIAENTNYLTLNSTRSGRKIIDTFRPVPPFDSPRKSRIWHSGVSLMLCGRADTICYFSLRT